MKIQILFILLLASFNGFANPSSEFDGCGWESAPEIHYVKGSSGNSCTSVAICVGYVECPNGPSMPCAVMTRDSTCGTAKACAEDSLTLWDDPLADTPASGENKSPHSVISQ
jgi:hypothetical protein